MIKPSKTIPLLFVLFIITFTIVILIFGYVSHSTFTGVVVENAYQKGLDFNKIYQTSLIRPDSSINADISILNQVIHLKLNVPIDNAQIEAKIVKPVSAQHDQLLLFTKQSSKHYTANLPHLTNGVWEIRIKILKNDKEHIFNRRFEVS